MRWPQFSRIFPEEGADWLAYWRERDEHRPECEFTQDGPDLRARELVGHDSPRRWVHEAGDVNWKEEEIE